jgi:hypothetical protein
MDEHHNFHTTTEKIEATELAEILIPHVDRRRVFMSGCLAAAGEFAKALLEGGECFSVVAPIDSINFSDAAIFWATFYHLIFKKRPDEQEVPKVIKNDSHRGNSGSMREIGRREISIFL